MQGAPAWQPEPDELSDFRLKAIAQIHSLYEQRKLEQQAEMMGMTGG